MVGNDEFEYCTYVYLWFWIKIKEEESQSFHQENNQHEQKKLRDEEEMLSEADFGRM